MPDEKSSFNINEFIKTTDKNSKKFHTALVNIQDYIGYCCDYCEDPEERIEALREQKEKLITLNKEINTFLKEYETTKKTLEKKGISLKETALVDSEVLELDLPLLTDLTDMDYKKNKNKTINQFLQKIHKHTQQAALKSTFTKAFYVYEGMDAEGEPGEERAAKNYFWGVPAKENKNGVVFFFEWLSYIMGGFLVIPIKNSLKFICEICPNYIATYFENRAENAIRKQSVSLVSILDFLFSTIAYIIFKPLWLLGRAVFSPITSAIAGAKFGFNGGYAIGNAIGNALGCGETFKTIFGTTLGVLGALILGLPSLAIGAAAVIATTITVPPVTVYVIGKIPVVGAQAAAWLTSTSETLSGLKLVSNIFGANQSIAHAVLPSMAESARPGAGLFASAQLTHGMQAALGAVTNIFYQIYKFCRTKPKPPSFSRDFIALNDPPDVTALPKPIPLSHKKIHNVIPFEKPVKKAENQSRHSPNIYFKPNPYLSHTPRHSPSLRKK